MKTRRTLVLCLMAVSGYAQSPGTFTSAGGMWTARSGHTATVLPDGKVLIAGGKNGPESNLASAELYDPSTGYFTRTGDMTTARSGQSATLLADGRVLITGGITGGVTADGAPCCVDVTSAELYDPSTGTFSPSGGTSTVGGIATLLQSGKVLITGITAQLYDPVTDRFAPAGSYAGPFYYGPFSFRIQPPCYRTEGSWSSGALVVTVGLSMKKFTILSPECLKRSANCTRATAVALATSGKGTQRLSSRTGRCYWPVV